MRALGINVPEVVAAGERIGPRAGLQSFLMVAELTGCDAAERVLPSWPAGSIRRGFAALKRRVIDEMARITATLARARVFHKDLYLCHFFLDPIGDSNRARSRLELVLIDLHRLEEHRSGADWWRWKDLGQLLFSTDGVAGITDRDRLRFWKSLLPARRDQAAGAGMRGWSGSERRVTGSIIANGGKAGLHDAA